MGVLKIGFHRQRPEPFFDTRLPASYSFPSGHAMLSFCLCLSAAALFSAGRKKRSWFASPSGFSGSVFPAPSAIRESTWVSTTPAMCSPVISPRSAGRSPSAAHIRNGARRPTLPVV